MKRLNGFSIEYSKLIEKEKIVLKRPRNFTLKHRIQLTLLERSQGSWFPQYKPFLKISSMGKEHRILRFIYHSLAWPSRKNVVNEKQSTWAPKPRIFIRINLGFQCLNRTRAMLTVFPSQGKTSNWKAVLYMLRKSQMWGSICIIVLAPSGYPQKDIRLHG